MMRSSPASRAPFFGLALLACLSPLAGLAQTPLAQTPLAQTPLAPREAPAIQVRSGQHADFSRLVFDWDRAVGYRVEQAGDQVGLTFDSPARLDLSQIQARLPARLRSIESSLDGGKRAVSLSLAEGSTLRHFRSGTKVVLDIAGPAGGQKAHAPAVKQKAAAPAAKPAEQAASRQADRHLIVDQAVSAVVAEPRAKPVPQARPADPREGAVPSTGPARSSSWTRGEPLTFALNTGAGAAAAAFRRGGRLWLVFDRPLPQGFARDLQAAVPDIAPLETIPLARAAILRLAVPPEIVPRLSPSPEGWQVTLSPGRPGPRMEPEIQVQSRPSTRLLYRVADEGRLLTVNDPDLGDRLTILAVAEPGLGQSEARRFPEFQTLATSQGFVVTALSDGLRVGLSLEGLSVISEEGLLVTTEDDLPRPVQPGEAQAQRQRILDLAAWRRGPGEDFDRNRQLLQSAMASEAADDAQQRLALARFYFSHGMAAETLSVLREMEALADPLLERPELSLIRGASHFMAQEMEQAASILAEPGLDGQIDATLWRAALAARTNDWPRAAELFQEAEVLIPDYVRRWRSDLRLLAAAARLGVGDTGGASLYLGAIHEDEPDGIQKARLDLLDARRFLADGRVNAAMDILGRLAKDPHRPTQAEARRVLVEQQYKTGEIDRAQTIEELERLRFLWRGDEFELELLDRLANLYAEIGDYRTALHRLRQLASRQPGSGRSNAAAQRMRQLFAEIFDRESGPPVPPLKAVAFYEEFKELTPLGREGARLIQSLARQLVEVELPDRAAEMLEETITPRLRGEPRAKLGAQLAEVYLRNRAPERALAALDKTRIKKAGEALARNRRHLRAKALADLGRYGEGLALLEKDASEPGLRLLSEIAWKMRNWTLAGGALARLVPKDPPADRPLSGAESRRVINLAIAHTMAQDRQALAGLRRRYGEAMAPGPHGESFALLTSDFGGVDVTAIMKELKDVDTVDSFIASYRSGGETESAEAGVTN